MSSAYEQAQQAGQGAVRAAICDAAIELLVAEGPAALTVRRIASAVGCSTKVIYTLFGGKDGLVEELWREGFTRFGQALGGVRRDADPVAYLEAIGRAYRAYALAEPHYYRIMFEGVVPGFEPSPTARQDARETFAVPVSAVEECLKAGLFAEADAVEIADTLWIAAHGVVSLELAGFFTHDEAERRFEKMADALISAYSTPT
ncbi:TetR/AcrR family transcriptional regulator [Streptosporangium sp. KLBMP 9127]|nr:TetR/AcrR family transcriptional regulator [Streptosporangium sp. KLBMP 9127]